MTTVLGPSNPFRLGLIAALAVAGLLVLGAAAVVSGGFLGSPTDPHPAALGTNSSTGSGVDNSSNLSVTLSAAPTSGPAPLTTYFNVSVTGGVPPYTYAWTFGDGGNGSGEWGSHTYLTAGSYILLVEVADSFEHTGRASVMIDVGPPNNQTTEGLKLNFSTPDPRGTAPLSATFTVSASGGTPPYGIDFCSGAGGCSPTVYPWSGSAHQFEAEYTSTGNFTAVATVNDSAGDLVTNTIPISVSGESPPLNISVLQSPSYGPPPLAVGFLATVSGGSAPYSIQWAWGDGTFGSSTNGGIVAHAYLSTGVYEPNLTVRDAAGETRTVDLTPVNVTTSNTTVANTRGGGLLPSGASGATSLEYAAVAAAAAAASAVSLGFALHRRRRAGEAARLARSLETEANRVPPAPAPTDAHG